MFLSINMQILAAARAAGAEVGEGDSVAVGAGPIVVAAVTVGTTGVAGRIWESNMQSGGDSP